MFIENFDKIYGCKLTTTGKLYDISKDSMVTTYNSYALRLTPVIISGRYKHFTIVLTNKEGNFVCGIYKDNEFSSIDTFDVGNKDLRSIELFSKLLAQKIGKHD